ncbi:MAG: ABC transporter substrate-binding protein, partial [Chloroflexales bacterium]
MSIEREAQLGGIDLERTVTARPAALPRTRTPAVRSIWGDVWRRLRANHLAMVSGAFVLLIIILALAAPLVAPKGYMAQDYTHLRARPSAESWLGTDTAGRDLWARIVYGGRVSLGEPAYSLISQDQPYAIDPKAYPEFASAYTFDPELAKSKLKGTPYEGGKNWPEVTLTLRPVGPTGKLVGEVIQQQLAQNLGFNIKVEAPEDSRVFITNVFGGNYQFIFYIWYTDYPDPSNHYNAVYYGPPAKRRFAWKSAEFDKLVEAAAGEQDKKKRADLYIQA